MPAPPRDPGLDQLLELNGEVYIISQQYWVKFEVHEVEVSASKPHGLKYSLTLHEPGNKRILGFDNSHPVAPSAWDKPHDHRHVLKSVKPYEYADAASLLEAFWAEVDRILTELGVL